MRSLAEHVHTLCVINKDLLCSGGNSSAQGSAMTHTGKNVRKEQRHMDTCITQSLHCTPQTNNTASQLLSRSRVRSAAPGQRTPGSSARLCLLARLKVTSIQSGMPSNHLCSTIKYS